MEIKNGTELYFIENGKIRLRQSLLINGTMYGNFNNSNPILRIDSYTLKNGIDLIKHKESNFNVTCLDGHYEILSLA